MKLFICLILQLLATCQVALSASDNPERKFKNCEKAWKLINDDWNAVIKQDQVSDPAFLSDARDYLTYCSAGMYREQRVRLLNEMGIVLLQTKQYSEAEPILEKCAKESAGIVGDYASCWEGLGEASAHLGNCEAAALAFRTVLDVPTTDNLSSVSFKLATAWLKNLYVPPPAGFGCPIGTTPSNSPPNSSGSHLFGTAFFISSQGLLLTNDHVVRDCKSVTLGTGLTVQIVGRDPKSDLALLKASSASENFAKFRSGGPAKVGEPVLAFGFPLHGTLSSSGSATTGIISSINGFEDDPRTLQFSAAIQPGSSGGPLFDGSGHVIGIVEAKLDALRMANATGTIPEGVGFAVQWSQIEAFLEREDVTPMREPSKVNLPTSDVADIARLVTVAVDCAQ